ncbi:glycosyltransferase family 2 protein [Pseudidiomarina salilacus]|uniref:glycosyltransferase family 2 protein n=1 Tax=Pseudidiomarina salilacus TaxID=3384452 RepID=UPI0039846804
MATYNGALYLSEQLESFLTQTRQPDELVISDDCSTDDTEAIVRAFAKKAPFPVLFYRNSANLGYTGNFNAALMQATGDLVFLSDQDDVWFADKIERMSAIAARSSEFLVVMNDAALTDAELREVGTTKIEQIRGAGYKMSSFVMGCCCAVKRPLLDLCLPIPDGIKGHDAWLVNIAQALGAKHVEPVVMQYYRRHETNESQIIANRTTRVTRVGMIREKFARLLAGRAGIEGEFETDYLEFYIKQLELLMPRLTEQQREQMRHCIEEKRAELIALAKRRDISELNFVYRLPKIAALYVQGYYRRANGLTSAIKDLFR